MQQTPPHLAVSHSLVRVYVKKHMKYYMLSLSCVLNTVLKITALSLYFIRIIGFFTSP